MKIVKDPKEFYKKEIELFKKWVLEYPIVSETILIEPSNKLYFIRYAFEFGENITITLPLDIVLQTMKEMITSDLDFVMIKDKRIRKTKKRMDKIVMGLSKKHTIIATGRLRRELNNETYKVVCPNGNLQTFYLPEKNDKEGIKKLTDDVLKFVKEQGCTKGQINSARKKLTEAGYFIEKQF